MAKLANKRIGYCPDCGSEVRLRKAPHLGQIVNCGSCGTTLEVVSREPLELDWSFEEPLDEEDELQFTAGRYHDYDEEWDSY